MAAPLAHNRDTAFGPAWTWVVPIVAAVATFAFVLLTTPPGFGAISDVLIGSARGPSADADAYALGSASSLSLLVLVLLTAAIGLVRLVWHVRR